MNKTYRLIWSRRLGGLIVAAETTRGRGKAACRNVMPAMLLSAIALSAQALPDGGIVSKGAADITTSVTTSGTTLTVNQKPMLNPADRNMVISWQKFSTSTTESVVFKQLDPQSIVLNRVIGTDSSTLLGSLQANGQVWLLNPNGVVIGAGATVNVGGLLASSLFISDDDFMSGKRDFTSISKGGGSVTNQGTITVGTNGEGGYVAMMGGTVSNEGTITAKLGTVALASGSYVTLDFNGDKLLSVGMGLDSALVQNKGSITANGGTVLLTAQGVNALLKTVVNNEGTIEAQTIGGAKGRMVLNGGIGGGTVSVAGTLDASGGSGTTVADGGTIVLASTQVKIADSAIITSAGAAGGKAGQLDITASGFTVADSATNVSSGTSAATLKNQLALNNVRIKTAAFASDGTGDIDIDAALEWATNNALTLDAGRDVNVNAAVTATGDKAGLTLKQGANADQGYHLNNGAKISLKSDAILVIAGKTYKVINGVSALQAMKDTLDGYYALGSDITAESTTNFTPVGTSAGKFSGILDGLGKTVTNLTINQPNMSYVGLIGYNYGTVRNIGLINVDANGASITGGLVGINDKNGVISDATVSGSVKSAGAFTGGLVSINDGAVIRSSSSAKVEGNLTLGGLVGYNFGTISYGSATGAVKGRNFTGGLVGYNSSGGKILNASATGAVDGEKFTGGLVGAAENTSGDSSILFVMRTGTVTGTEVASTGALIGENIGVRPTFINYAYANGKVNGVDLMEALNSSLLLIGSTNLNDVAGYDQVRAFGADAMKQQVNFKGFDFTNTWRIYENNTTPLLKAFLKPITVSANNANKIYDGNPYTDPVAGISTLVAGADLKGTLIYGIPSQAPIDADTYGLNGLWSTAYDISYGSGRLTINPKTLMVSTLAPVTKVYDGKTQTEVTLAGQTLSGVKNQQIVVANLLAKGEYNSANVNEASTVKIQPGNGAFSPVDGTSLSNYTFLAAGKITPALLSVTASNVSKTYDGIAYSGGSFTYNGFVNNETAATAPIIGTLAIGAAQGAKDAGSYAITPSGGSSANYSMVFVPGTLIIMPKNLIASFGSTSTKVYDGTTSASLVFDKTTLSGFVGDERITANNGNVNGVYNSKNMGEATTVTATLSDGNFAAASNTKLTNYTLQVEGVIKPKAAFVTAPSSLSRDYNGQAYNGEDMAYAGFVPDELADIKKIALGYGQAQGMKDVGSYIISPAGSFSTNYAVTFVPGTFTITPKILTASFSSTPTRVYNGTRTASLVFDTNTLRGLVAGESITPKASNISGVYNSKNVADASKVAIALNADNFEAGTGTKLTNYSLQDVAATITRARLTVTANPTRVYDGQAYDGSGLTYRDFVPGETEATVAVQGAFTYAGSAQAPKDAGRYAMTTTGLSAANYEVTYVPGILTITPKNLSASFLSMPTKVYDSTTAASLVFDQDTLSGLVTGESITARTSTINGTYNSKNVTEATTVEVALSADYFTAGDGTKLANYQLSNVAATITPAALTVKANDTLKRFDGKVYSGAQGLTIQGFVGGETSTVLTGAVRYTGSAEGARMPGSYAILPAGLSAANYKVRFVEGTLVIEPYIFTAAMTGTAPHALVGQRRPPKVTDNRVQLAEPRGPAKGSECTKLQKRGAGMQCGDAPNAPVSQLVPVPRRVPAAKAVLPLAGNVCKACAPQPPQP